MLEQPRQHVRDRRAVIAAHADLRERELMKLTAMAAAGVKALRARGVAEPAARLIAETSITVFRVGLDRWLDDKKSRDLVTNIRLAFEDLKALYRKTG
jgi:hypothetical protein